MAENDLAERVRQYAAFLGDRIQAEKAIEREESMAGSITALQRLQVYRAVRDELYRLCPEAIYYKPLLELKPKTGSWITSEWLTKATKEAAEFGVEEPSPLVAGRPTGKPKR